jgi:nucleoside-diphosphate-sugar epimerase
LTHPCAANKTYLLSDGEDVSTPELVRRLAQAMGQPARLLPVPPRLLELTARLVGKGQEVQRLLDSLAVDSGKIRRELGWQPPYSMEEGLAETAVWYRASLKSLASSKLRVGEQVGHPD